MTRLVFIMAGGSGERFWPISRSCKPKQLLCMTDSEQTMLEDAIERISSLIPPERIFIITGELLKYSVSEAMEGILPEENIILEPLKRNTAACLALGAAYAGSRFPEDDVSIAVLTADHIIGEPETFRETVDRALAYAEENPALVTIGIKPARPETGYGYIEAGEEAAPGVFKVHRFREKPNRQTAQEYVDSGRFLWNSGMFFWSLKTFKDGLKRYMTPLFESFKVMEKAVRDNDGELMADTFNGLESISIDYGLMEKADNVFVTPASFPWDDVGTWDALERTHSRDKDGNVAIGGPVLLDCRGCIVNNHATAEKMAVVVMGMEDVVVITTPDGILICNKEQVQEVRRAVKVLYERGMDRFC
ncbi:MAG: sugar phosphate nucleotidyltransferase [Chloroflexi bacterium]|nr:sugar phosphate nucleotidyltransferase [Chloroflexota bacterium]